MMEQMKTKQMYEPKEIVLAESGDLDQPPAHVLILGMSLSSWI